MTPKPGLYFLSAAFGSAAGGHLGAESLLLARGTVLAMAAGTFLFMGTLNDL